ncbi:hypothetical protein [uncultured Gammaproteobacteria bacterium]|jgi:hypothetical protein|nr:hypothetical protein BROOK1789B_928 [Bathymodiolus brooksi thiotrophic gill symbiont]CAC9550811.1 hypothetical protein [uncultured Gammaproteobacteria bacterium]CAB9542330.1 hypothetical protein BROOK1789C_155 [Bathymodiolus brooksi thiotrophic gill symbiont]CAC9552854.1 hypothetical protein [uncultured Gammaproteobacteria bacterium]CAC9555797.1 hypothetical protein [uncultured Gammaproteobacteria bacterium]
MNFFELETKNDTIWISTSKVISIRVCYIDEEEQEARVCFELDGGKYKSLSSATLSLEECDDLVNKFLAVSEK